ncbi:hypothetical protein AWENTII_004306 [Aspergillus wentii]
MNIDEKEGYGRDTNEEYTAWEPPSNGSNPSQLTPDHGVFNEQNYVNSADMEALVSTTIDTSPYSSGSSFRQKSPSGSLKLRRRF